MSDPATPRNTPVWAFGALALMLIVGVTLIVTDHGEAGGGALIIGVLVANLPGAIAAIYAERTSRDVRNGTVTAKAQEGAAAAIEEKAETIQAAAANALDERQVVTRTGPLATETVALLTAHTDALTKLLETTEEARREQAGTKRTREGRRGDAIDGG